MIIPFISSYNSNRIFSCRNIVRLFSSKNTNININDSNLITFRNTAESKYKINEKLPIKVTIGYNSINHLSDSTLIVVMTAVLIVVMMVV